MFCPKCGGSVNANDQFCTHCGSPLNNTGASTNNASTTDKAKNFFADMQAHADDRKAPESVDFTKAIQNFFLYALNFKGRSSRSEYWWSFLFNMLASTVLTFVPFIGGLISLALMVPSIAVGIRRLHDIGKSGWYYLMCLIPLAGPIIILVYLCTSSRPEANQWGPSAQ